MKYVLFFVLPTAAQLKGQLPRRPHSVTHYHVTYFWGITVHELRNDRETIVGSEE